MTPATHLRRRARIIPSGRSAKASPAPPRGQGSGLKSNTTFRWAWYLLSLFIPMAGILVALILYDQDDREVRKVGRTCLLIGFLVWVVIPFLVFLGLLILGALAVAGLVFNVLSQMD